MAIDTALLNSLSSRNTLLAQLSQLASINNATGIPDVASGPMLALLDQQSTSYQIEISDFGTILSDLSSLQDAASALAAPSALSSVASSSNPSVLTATTDSAAAPGFFSVQVNQVAQPQVLMSAGLASSTAPIGSGAPTTLTFQFGTTSGGSFIPNPGQPPQTVTIDAGTNSLEGIAAAINGAGVGVNAFVVRDAAGDHLQVATAGTGASSSLSIDVTGDAALAGLLTYTPGGLQAMTQVVAPQDAQFTVNGLPATRSSNTVTDAVPGLTLDLAGSGSATVSVASDGTPAVGKITAFVSAFNALQSDINTLSNGDLQGTPLIKGLRTQLQDILQTNQFETASTGLTIQPDGSLTLDTTALQNALNTDPAGVAALFSNSAGGGLADQSVGLAQTYTDPTTGILPTQISSLAHGLQVIQTAGQTTFLQAQFFALSNLQLSLQGTDQFLSTQLGLTSGLGDLGSLIGLAAQNPNLLSLFTTG